MKDYYELECYGFWHLKEYHEILIFTERHKIKDKKVRDNLEVLIENEAYDIWEIMPFTGIPDIIYAAGNLDTLVDTDYPVVKNSNLLIISKRFLDALLSVKQFEFIAVPVTVYDALEPHPFLENGELKSFVKHRTDFFYIKLLNFIDIDWENSVYSSGKHHRNNLDFERLSLQIPENGLDPIFRLRQFPNSILISKEACKIAKKQGIKGVRLSNFPALDRDNIDDFFYDSYVDEDD